MQFNPLWNAHYDFNDEAHRAEIDKVERYDIKRDTRIYRDGDVISSPWGDNRVLISTLRNGQDVCVKSITVKPGFMLSLQRHRWREETCEVQSGILTMIADGKRIELKKGDSLRMKRGTVHSLNNLHEEPVVLVETQLGFNREADNVRLVDFNGRPTYPLTTENEWHCAHLYARLQHEIAALFGTGKFPHPALVKAA
jgi:mannose-6-phosphate isomerase-like protein (cupin superfamily)